jgi:hypothetical protein
MWKIPIDERTRSEYINRIGCIEELLEMCSDGEVYSKLEQMLVDVKEEYDDWLFEQQHGKSALYGVSDRDFI